MTLLTWLVVGGLFGWLASMLGVNNGRQGVLTSILIGAIGGPLGGWVSGLLGIGSVNQDSFSIWTAAVGMVGALVLIGLVDLAQRWMAAR